MDDKERELMNKVVKAQGRAVNAKAAAKSFNKRNGYVTPKLSINVMRTTREYNEAVAELESYREDNS